VRVEEDQLEDIDKASTDPEQQEDMTDTLSPYLPILWPISPSIKIKNQKQIKINSEYFYNPYISPKAEIEEKLLFCRENPLYWPHHPIQDLLNNNRLPIIAVVGPDGSGKTALGIAWSIYAPLNESIGVHISGCPDANIIFRETVEQLLKFICNNPAHLCFLDNLHRKNLGALLSGTLGFIAVHGRLDRAIKAYKRSLKTDQKEKSHYEIELEIQWELLRKVLDPSPPSIEPSDWFPALEEIIVALNFKYARLVFDSYQDVKFVDFDRKINAYRNLYKVLNQQTLLLINSNQYQKWSQAGDRIEKYGPPVHHIYWREQNRNLLDTMLKKRWEVYNENQIVGIVGLNEQYQKLLELAEDNPAEFIRLWCEHFRF
jgi:hypothetical protein